VLLSEKNLVNKVLRKYSKDRRYHGMTSHAVMLMEVKNISAHAQMLEHYKQCNYEGALLEIDQFDLRAAFYRQVTDSWRAHFCLLLGKYDEANRYLNQVQLNDPEGHQYFAIKGHWHLVHGEEKAAIECYLRHNDKKSLEEDFHHIELVFGIKPPQWK